MTSQPAFTPLFPDTIFALSSGRMPAGVSVVRMSGPSVRFALETIGGVIPVPRRATLRELSVQGQPIDRGLLLFFPGPRSFTGEDCAEFQVHGGRAVVEALLDALSGVPGARPAEAGEFARRAFAYGKLDLTEAEGLADLIAAETEGQRRLALSVANGAQRVLYESWRMALIQARALIEAELDFSDEADVPRSAGNMAWPQVAAVAERIDAYLSGARRGEILRDGFRVVILGRPNAGKSSLLNALAGREVAIVSEEAGTTRDLIEVTLDLGGIPVLMTDTAGLREAEGGVERRGIELALERAKAADLIVYLIDVTSRSGEQDPRGEPGTDAAGVETWRIGTKADLAHGEGQIYDHVVSATTGAGLDGLLAALETQAKSVAGEFGEIVPTRQRHLALLRMARDELRSAARSDGLGAELRVEYLRRACDDIGRLTGAVGVEEVLDVVFSSFCIGK